MTAAEDLRVGDYVSADGHRTNLWGLIAVFGVAMEAIKAGEAGRVVKWETKL